MDRTPPTLKRSPLKSVVCELRFPTRLTTEDDAKGVQAAFGGDYPFADTQQALLLTPEGGIQPRGDAKRYVFSSLDHSHQILFTAKTLALECTSNYEGWEKFLKRWEGVLRAGQEALGLQWQQRIGLRYVNQLDADQGAGLAGMRGRINPALLAPLDDESGLFGDIRTTGHESRIGVEHGVCTVRHGFQEVPDDKAAYLLDFDYYSDEMRPLDVAGQLEQLKNFNFGVWQLFTWCLTKEEFERMEPEERSA